MSYFDPAPQDTEQGTPLLEVRRPDRYLDDLILDEYVCESLYRSMEEFYEWEVLEANGLQPLQRILFCGPSGCGKTATAEALATQLDLPLLYVRFDAVVSSLLGETASNIRRVFDYAQRGQWVILFDEFDAIGRSRSDSTEHGEIKRVVNSFLQIMDSFKGRSLIIASTNFEQALDPAVWRRFDEVLRFVKPTREQIMSLSHKLLARAQVRSEYEMVLADNLENSTFADIERVCTDILKSCVLRGDRYVNHDDVTKALTRHYYREAVTCQGIQETFPFIDTE